MPSVALTALWTESESPVGAFVRQCIIMLVHALLRTAVLPPLLTGATQRCGNAQHPLYDSFTWWTGHPNEWVDALANDADFSVSPPGNVRLGPGCTYRAPGQKLGFGTHKMHLQRVGRMAATMACRILIASWVGARTPSVVSAHGRRRASHNNLVDNIALSVGL